MTPCHSPHPALAQAFGRDQPPGQHGIAHGVADRADRQVAVGVDQIGVEGGQVGDRLGGRGGGRLGLAPFPPGILDLALGGALGTILLVEDEEAVRAFGARALSALGLKDFRRWYDAAKAPKKSKKAPKAEAAE